MKVFIFILTIFIFSGCTHQKFRKSDIDHILIKHDENTYEVIRPKDFLIIRK